MTIEEAQKEAEKRWGDMAKAHISKDPNGSEAYIVGVIFKQGVFPYMQMRGVGKSFEEAFKTSEKVDW